MTPQADQTHRRAIAPTIYDIAAATGVNASTVSRALGKPGRVRKETVERVLEAARRLDYRPNPMARALPTGRTHTVGLIVADLTNPVFFDIVLGAQSAAAGHGCTLLLASSQEDPERERVAAQRLAAGTDGLVLATSRLEDDDIEYLARATPVVVVNRDVPGVPSIVADPTPGIADAVEHLHGLGHRRLTYLQGPGRSWISGHRHAVLEAEASRRGMEVVLVPSGEPTMAGGRTALAAVRATEAGAVVAFNDLLALGLLQQCEDDGIDVPGELSIVGFDDIFGADLTRPRLTTIRSPLRQCGDRAARLLLGRWDDDPDGDGGVPSTMPAAAASAEGPLLTELVIRGSTGRRADA